MPIRQTLRHRPTIQKIEKEGDVRELVSDLKREMSLLNHNYNNYSLMEIFNLVKKGLIPVLVEGCSIGNEIDFSEAKKILEDYRISSEGEGCIYCVNARWFKPYSDETRYYCSLYESEKDADETGKSPNVNQYWNGGCIHLEHKFKKTIEEILTD